MAVTVGMVEATAITGMAMVFLGMVIITAIAIISSLITAAGNGAPTARSMSATAIIDAKRRKDSSPGPRGSGDFFDTRMIPVIILPGAATNPVDSSSTARSFAPSAPPLNAFALASRSMRVERTWQKKLRVPAAASWICDAPHICRHAGGLGFNSREVRWGDFGPSAARNKQAIVDSC
jgi:hypothetical protein